ncbi:hypothetical protein Tco_0824888 [Tanacetum coccineum]
MKIISGEQLIKSSSKNNAKDNPFTPASLDYDHDMVLKSKDWVERLNIDNKLPNFNTGRILVPESEAVHEYEKINSIQKIQEPKSMSLQPESSKSVNLSKQSQDSKPNCKNHDSSKPVRPKPLQKPKLKCELCNYTNHSTDGMKCKRGDHKT